MKLQLQIYTTHNDLTQRRNAVRRKRPRSCGPHLCSNSSKWPTPAATPAQQVGARYRRRNTVQSSHPARSRVNALRQSQLKLLQRCGAPASAPPTAFLAFTSTSGTARSSDSTTGKRPLAAAQCSAVHPTCDHPQQCPASFHARCCGTLWARGSRARKHECVHAFTHSNCAACFG